MTRFAELARLSLDLKSTAGRLASMERIARFLRSLEAEEIRPSVLMLLGRVRPPGDPIKLEVSGAVLGKAVRVLAGPREEGSGPSEDIGTAIRDRLEASASWRAPAESSASILEVHEALLELGEVAGKGAAARRVERLRDLLARLSLDEAEILSRIVVHDMRHGADEGVVLEAIARMLDIPRARAARAQMLLGDVSRVAEIGLREGPDALRAVGVEYFRPLKPMLAQKAETIAEALEICGGRASIEHKLDGARLQIHLRGGEIRLFTRRLSEVTESLPDVIAAIRRALPLEDGIAEGELVPIDRQGRLLPFQELMRRFRRVHGVEDNAREVGARLYLFDLLAADGEVLLDAPLEERQGRLEATLVESKDGLAEVTLVPRLLTSSAEEGQRFYDDAVGRGYEGVMVKDSRSAYTPGVRGRAWLKVKKIHTLDLAVVAADWGYGRRRGWLSNYHLAVRDRSGDLVEVGKTFKGMTDAEFEEMTGRLLALKTSEVGHTVRCRPAVVLEIAYSDIQRSPQYACGFALRFARVVRVRDDKTVAEIDTLDSVREQYERQQAAAF
jgi:DNA ligase-1